MESNATETPVTPTPEAPANESKFNSPLSFGFLADALSNVNHDLGAVCDLLSYKQLNMRAMEYELTIKQLASCAAFGNKAGFEQMVSQLIGAIHNSQVGLVASLRSILDAKLAQVEKPGRQEEVHTNCAVVHPPLEGTSQCH